MREQGQQVVTADVKGDHPDVGRRIGDRGQCGSQLPSADQRLTGFPAHTQVSQLQRTVAGLTTHIGEEVRHIPELIRHRGASANGQRIT
jgi:hypothetical protein